MSPSRIARLVLTLWLWWPLGGQAMACPEPDTLSEFVASTYGSRIEFDVLRNGKAVGEHVTEFRREERGLHVDSRMRLGVSIAFIPVYEFTYHSSSTWCGEQLLALDATTSDDGDVSTTSARFDSDAMVITAADVERRGRASLLPSDHWNPRVLQRGEILNTITGQINAVTIRNCVKPSPQVTRRVPGAHCFEYRGDLEARVWYTNSGRWVGLEFAGRDGSEIIYVCRQCGDSGRAL